MFNRSRIGFMQGRFSPVFDGKIQEFPLRTWEGEFPLAHQFGFTQMEWVLDAEHWHKTPLLYHEGQQRIKQLCQQFNLTIPSVTGDFYMAEPLHKHPEQQQLCLAQLHAAIQACGRLHIPYLVIPLLDESHIANPVEENMLITAFLDLYSALKHHHVRLLFESDYPPQRLKEFIHQFPQGAFGINYDIGNSASLGYDPREEIQLYGDKIFNVHVKDRVLHGNTVSLGMGSADFPTTFQALADINYDKNYILQIARANNGDHAGVLIEAREKVYSWNFS